jgi:hypothetical protein
MVGSIKLQSATQSTGKQGHPASTPASSQTVTNTKYAPSPAQTSEVNVIQSTSSQQPGGKKKNKGKSKKYSNQQESTKPQTTVETKPKRKVKFPCLICGDDHYTKYCPHHEEVTKFLKGTSQPTVLTDPFPPQQQQMVSQNPCPSARGKCGSSSPWGCFHKHPCIYV